MLDSRREVIRCLITYTDWAQPISASIIKTGAGQRTTEHNDGLRPGLLETIEERFELCRRVEQLSDRERLVLFFSYVEQLPVAEIARRAEISYRYCNRVRARAIQRIMDLGDPSPRSDGSA